MAFEVGDRVYLPQHGVGVVRGLSDDQGTEGCGRVYAVELIKSGLTQTIPLTRGLRALIPPSAIDRVHDVLRESEAPRFHGSWQEQYREYTHRVATGDPLMVAGVLRELHQLGTERALSYGERRMYDQVRGLIVEEIAIVSGLDEKVVQAEVDMILEPSRG